MRIIIVLMVLLTFGACRNTDPKDNQFVDVAKVLERQSKQLIGKSLLKWSSIVDSNDYQKSPKVILLYNGQDCNSCVKRGLDIVEKIHQDKSIKSIIFSSQSNSSNDRVHLGYEGFIYNDELDILRKELNYCYTPVILIIGTDNKIINVHFPQTNDNTDKVSQQLGKILTSGL